MWFYDLRSGIRIKMLPGWTPQSLPTITKISHPILDRTSVAAMLSSLELGDAVKSFLEYIHEAFSWRLLDHRIGEIGKTLVVEFRSMVEMFGTGLDQQLGMNTALYGRVYVRDLGGRRLVSGWIAPEGASVDLGSMDEVARSVWVEKPIELEETSLTDVVKGIEACRMAFPRGWESLGQAFPSGAITFNSINIDAAMSLSGSPPFRYVDGQDPYRVQAFLAQGFVRTPYMDPVSYGRQYVEKMGYGAEPVFEIGPPPTLSLATGFYRMFHAPPYNRYVYGSVILRLLGSPLAGYAWSTTYGVSSPGLIVWEGAVYMITGPPEKEELMLRLLLGITASVEFEPSWASAILNERSSALVSLAEQRGRMTSTQLEEARREMAHRRRIMAQFREAMSEVRRTTMETFYSNLHRSVRETQRISDILGAPWRGGRGGAGGLPTSRAGGGTLASRRDVRRFDWAGGGGTFFIDYEGRVRSLDYDEEVVAHEIGPDGTLYDEEGNVVGRVYEGYVYDTEGNQVGRLDVGISDQWALEQYEQEIPWQDEVLGTYTESSNQPYFVTRRKKDEEED